MVRAPVLDGPGGGRQGLRDHLTAETAPLALGRGDAAKEVVLQPFHIQDRGQLILALGCPDRVRPGIVAVLHASSPAAAWPGWWVKAGAIARGFCDVIWGPAAGKGR